MKQAQLIYLMDPQCGWCFGFSDTIVQIASHFRDNECVNMSLVTGGLFSPALATTPTFAQEKMPIAERVSKIFGVQFADDYFTNVLSSGNLDSLPPCLVINTVASKAPDAVFAFSKQLIDAAFKQARNISELSVCLDVAAEYGFKRDEIKKLASNSAVKDKTHRSFQFAKKAGTGFPSLLLQDEKSIHHIGGAQLTLKKVDEKVASILD